MHSVTRQPHPCPSNTRHWFRPFLVIFRCLDTGGGGGYPGGRRRGRPDSPDALCRPDNRPQAAPALRPTAGLDSFNAQMVMLSLKAMSKLGYTVVTVIHQPSPVVWGFFDHVLLLSLGHLMYSGPPRAMVPWLCGGLGEGYVCPRHVSPCDYALQLVTVGHRKPDFLFGRRTMRSPADVARASAKWAERERPGARRWALVRQAVRSGRLPGAPAAAPGGGARARAALRAELPPLLRRTLRVAARSPSILLARVVTYALFGLLVGLFFGETATADARLGELFLVYNALFLLPFTSISLYQDDRHHYRAERSMGVCGVPAYYLVHTCLDVVLGVISAVCAALPFYFLCALEGHFGQFLLPFLLAACVGTQLIQVPGAGPGVSCSLGFTFFFNLNKFLKQKKGLLLIPPPL